MTTHVCKLIALYTADAYSAEREMSASACTRCMASCEKQDECCTGVSVVAFVVTTLTLGLSLIASMIMLLVLHARYRRLKQLTGCRFCRLSAVYIRIVNYYGRFME